MSESNPNQIGGNLQKPDKSSVIKVSDHEAEPPKAKKPEEKPFKDFINEDFIPNLKHALESGLPGPINIELIQGERPVVGGTCWMVFGELAQGRKFWICFSSESITSNKTISLSEAGNEASILESFLIDERKMTLSLLLSRTLQRLNGQKWLGAN